MKQTSIRVLDDKDLEFIDALRNLKGMCLAPS
jgi:hypothetical protein